MATHPSPSTSTGGINRSALRNASATAARPPEAAPRPPAAPAAAQRESPPESDFIYFLKAVGWMSGGLVGAIVLYALVWLMHDSMATGAALAEAKQQRGTLVCQSGHMSHGDGSLHDLVFAESFFVCDDWKTLQTIQEEEQKAGSPQMKATQAP
ncbi:hypothetical protein SNE35_01500 [Paucibacter sp. R3-3]|uniref:Uncharacterized protein n=1 Tax=Roseateles agri TaxID=3098619 RepID=A0ABU5DDA6_9BURK|nr:hypothetical protein [Paucibacter sp. R3-3]MDY0743157.1 hypothetical protein [Paucibacter sp. R3-3]